MLKEIYTDTEARMKGAIQVLEEDLAGIRTGRAHPALVEKIQVDYYGMPTPIMQIATVSVPEPRALLIKPFEQSMLKPVEKAIMASDLNLTPNNDGKQIRLNLPPLTEERRRDLVKVVHHRLEEARVAARNIRRDMIRDLTRLETDKKISTDDRKQGEKELQKITDHYIEEINTIGVRKEKEIMEV